MTPETIKKITTFFKHAKNKKKTEMICFIMYDIEKNKIRTRIAKYLEAKGCFRVQKSVFVAQLHRKTYADIENTLRDIQGACENSDSILLAPISDDEIRSMKIIGKLINLELLLNRRHTLIF